MRLNLFARHFSDGATKLLLRYLRRIVGRRKIEYDLADILGAILHVLRTGVPWYDLDDDPRFPPKSTVYYYFAKWSKAYVFDELNQMFTSKLRHSRRVKQRNTKPRPRQPTACVRDSKTVRSRVWGPREARGFDGHKRTNGIKHHTATYTAARRPGDVNGPGQ